MPASRLADVKKKMRLDKAVTERGLLRSRTLAKEYIENGHVTVNGVTVSRPSTDIQDSDMIELSSPLPRYVSRGGLKLEAALDSFGINVNGAVCCDIGASTGGFTDCLLKHGASRVYAVDSGTDQLDPVLRGDGRVVSIEQFNARELNPAVTGVSCDVVTADVSFISQTLIIKPAFSVLRSGGFYIGLIKPQFECGKRFLGKGGIVKDDSARKAAAERVTGYARSLGSVIIGVIPSPIMGGDGNAEFLFCAVKN